MKLYTTRMAPYPRRVDIYLRQKGIVLERQELDLHAMEQRNPDFLRKNPAGQVPLLEFDDGRFLPESQAIIEYLEERFPTPPMIGRTAEERAQVRATDGIAGQVFTVLGLILLHTSPVAAQLHPGITQFPQVGIALQPILDRLLDQLEHRIGENDFLAGPAPTVADCTFFALMGTVCPGMGYELPERCGRLRAWYERFRRHPIVLD